MSRAVLAHRSVALFAVAAICLLSAAPVAQAGCTPSCAIRASDEVFEVNVRGACSTTNVERLRSRMVVREFDPGCGSSRWLQTDFARITESGTPGVSTIFYVHGNQVSASDARRRSLDVYRRLVQVSCDERPIRFVVFSWPADEESGVLKDFRLKAARTRPAGWQLAWVLSQMSPDTQVGLIGYSYGARIVGGAAHVLGGGNLSGLSLCDCQAEARPPLRVAFIAAATHAHWFGTGRYHGRAMTQIDQLMLLINNSDPAMRFYKWVEKNSSPTAMGLRGPCCLNAEQRSRVKCYNCSTCVGRSHDLYEYMAPQGTMAQMWRHLTHAN